MSYSRPFCFTFVTLLLQNKPRYFLRNFRVKCSMRNIKNTELFSIFVFYLLHILLPLPCYTVTDCMMDFATETVMQLCHGKRRCSVVANSTTFGRPDPCSPDSKTYLKVVYTCGERKKFSLISLSWSDQLYGIRISQ